MVQLAKQHQLPLLIHCDPVVIDTTFEIDPNAKVIWAHASKYPYPPLLRDYLNRYPNLMIALSVREDLVATDGVLNEDWEMLLVEYPDRFLVGVDTYSSQRWVKLKQVTQQIRQYLNGLPEDTKKALAYKNVQRLFDF